MNRCLWMRRIVVLAVLAVLAGCGSGAADDAADPASTVAVSTAAPRQQTFHATIDAFGSALGDPQRARSLSLAYGGEILAVDVAAGQSVRRAQPLLVISADPATRSAYQQAQAAVALARGDLERTVELAGQRLATQSQVAAARKALADADAALRAQQAIGGASARSVVAAPADGVVNALHVSLGERVAANAPLLSFTPAHALLAQLGVQLGDGAELRAGMKARLQAVYGDSAPLTGTLRMVGRTADPVTHLLPVQVELDAAAGDQLPAGAAVTAQIEAGSFRAWAVPRAAVLRDDNGSYLFQARAGRARRVAVTVRQPNGETLGVEGAIDPALPIIVLGVYELADGDAVRVTPAPGAAARPSGAAAAEASR